MQIFNSSGSNKYQFPTFDKYFSKCQFQISGADIRSFRSRFPTSGIHVKLLGVISFYLFQTFPYLKSAVSSSCDSPAATFLLRFSAAIFQLSATGLPLPIALFQTASFQLPSSCRSPAATFKLLSKNIVTLALYLVFSSLSVAG
jgi:hypothetical protein